MLLTKAQPRERRRSAPPVVGHWDLEDSSPYGLQGLRRPGLSILKADRMSSLAALLATSSTAAQLRDAEYVTEWLQQHPEWCDHYAVVHLVDSTLWMAGQHDLVMTLLPNPSQVPDEPPEAVHRVLTDAYLRHPQSTIWYGVPLFGQGRTVDELPIPVTAEEVRTEAARLANAVRLQALRWRWAYRSAARLSAVPMWLRREWVKTTTRWKSAADVCVETVKQARRDARRRTRAMAVRELECCHRGVAWTALPQHRTWLGTFAARWSDRAEVAGRWAEASAPAAGLAAQALVLPGLVASLLPSLAVPTGFVLCDPFLFLELPDEPGQLRLLAHWYWQPMPDGSRKLHLHQ
jgi:hypothetical protein